MKIYKILEYAILNILCISDTHGLNNKLASMLNQYNNDKLDLLLFAGDICGLSSEETENSFKILSEIPAEYKIMIGGNHDFGIDKWGRELAGKNGFIYLENESCEIQGYKIFGSPYSVTFGDWAFMKPDNELEDIWGLIPDDTDILITHSPPFDIMDKNYKTLNCGSNSLLRRVEQVKPKLHVFGHIHESQGVFHSKDTIFVNASVSDFLVTTINDGIVINI